jgi:UDP-N-acetylglucosamine transferase subunit ALG13
MTDSIRTRGGTLLVASGGGHLTQLAQLLPRLEGLPGPYTWVTFDTAQARSMLEGQEVVWAQYTAPRDVAKVLANAVLAAKVLRAGRYQAVVSTGAAVALSFLPLAALAGASVHYIESATRVVAPSATGRLLARVPGIKTYTQHPGWADGRWAYAGSVLDGHKPAPTKPRRIRKVVVAVGTMETYGFRRLLERMRALLPADAEVLWQTGCTDISGLGIDGRRAVPAAELNEAMRDADVVVTHAGTGSALAALAVGKIPVLVPRSAARGEHVDDHQQQTAAELAARGLAVSVEAEKLGPEHLVTAASLKAVRNGTPAPLKLAGLDELPEALPAPAQVGSVPA